MAYIRSVKKSERGRWFWTLSPLVAILPFLLLQPEEGLCQVNGMKTFSNRIEGTAIEQHGNPEITALGIHRSFEQFSVNSTLSIRFFLPSRLGVEPRKVGIEAREILDTNHYLMQAKPLIWTNNAWQVFNPWPTRDVIDPLQIGPANLGILVSYKDGNSQPVYVPVDVFSTAVSSSDRYVVWFRASQDLHALEGSITDSTGHGTNTKRSACKASPDCTLYAAATTHAVTFDFSGYPDGIYKVQLTGSVSGSADKQSLSFYLVHHSYKETN